LLFVEQDGPELDGSHFDTANTPSILVAPFLHYKFLPNFSDKCDEAIESGQHWRDGQEYKAYKKVRLEERCFKKQDSIKVKSGVSLSGYVQVITKVIVDNSIR
jgi:hypothetical protein